MIDRVGQCGCVGLALQLCRLLLLWKTGTVGDRQSEAMRMCWSSPAIIFSVFIIVDDRDYW